MAWEMNVEEFGAANQKGPRFYKQLNGPFLWDFGRAGCPESFSLQRGIWTLGTWAKDHLCYILEKNLAVSHKYLEHQSEEA